MGINSKRSGRRRKFSRCRYIREYAPPNRSERHRRHLCPELLPSPFPAQTRYTTSHPSTKALSTFLGQQDPKNVCAILAERFPGHHILAVAANRIEAGFACYDHWLTGTNVEGDPSAYVGASFRASSHLASLLVQLGASALKGLFPAPNSPVTLVLAGFSKGGVVLNQACNDNNNTTRLAVEHITVV